MGWGGVKLQRRGAQSARTLPPALPHHMYHQGRDVPIMIEMIMIMIMLTMMLMMMLRIVADAHADHDADSGDQGGGKVHIHKKQRLGGIARKRRITQAFYFHSALKSQ